MDDGQIRTFKVKFEGEGVDDYGGPYRETFAQMISELQATTRSVARRAACGDGEKLKELERAFPAESERCMLPLLGPSPNRRQQRGARKDSFVIRPPPAALASTLPTSASIVRRCVAQLRGSGAEGSDELVSVLNTAAPVYLESYCFLGRILGVALRNGISLQLGLVPAIWRSLVGQPSALGDVDDSDEAFSATLRGLRTDAVKRRKSVQPGAPVDWRTLSSIGEEIALVAADGKDAGAGATPRTEGELVGQQAKDAALLCEATAAVRLFESWLPTLALQEGLTSVIPTALLPLFTAEEFEERVCGRPGVDVRLLAANTDYDDDIGPEDEHIKSFWRVLAKFSDEDRSKFLRFVWARPRLPANGEFSQRFKIQAPAGDSASSDPDRHLPKAHTCFFSFNLPRYSSDAVMRKQLLYAITNCVTMDADFRLTDGEMTGWD